MLTLVFLASGFIAGAQDAGDVLTDTETVPVRPAETDLLFDDDAGIPADDQTPGAVELPGVGFGDFLRVIIVLGIVIALIYGFVWMLRKFSGVKAEGGDIIQLYSTRPLKGDAALHLVEVGTRVFLVGSNSNSINLISEIDDKESLDEIRLNASSNPQPAPGGFARFFKDRFGTGPSGNDVTDPTSSSSSNANGDPGSYLRKQRERLKDL